MILTTHNYDTFKKILAAQICTSYSIVYDSDYFSVYAFIGVHNVVRMIPILSVSRDEKLRDKLFEDYPQTIEISGGLEIRA
jgi:hypothetical protein